MNASHIKLELLPNGQVKIIAGYGSGYDLAANVSYLINQLFSALVVQDVDLAAEFGAAFSMAAGDIKSPVWSRKAFCPSAYAELMLSKNSATPVVLFDEMEGTHESG